MYNCDKRAVNVAKLDAVVRKVILSWIDADEKIDRIVELAAKGFEQQAALANPKIAVIEKKVRGIDRKLLNLNNAIADGVYTPSTKTMLQTLEEEKSVLVQELAEMERLLTGGTYTADEWRDALRALRESASMESNDILFTFVNKIIAYNDHLVILSDLNGGDVSDCWYLPDEVPTVVGAQHPIK